MFYENNVSNSYLLFFPGDWKNYIVEIPHILVLHAYRVQLSYCICSTITCVVYKQTNSTKINQDLTTEIMRELAVVQNEAFSR